MSDNQVSSSSMTSLVVMVVHKYKSVSIRQHSPGFSEWLKVGKRIVFTEGLSNVVAIFEFSDSSQMYIFTSSNSFTSKINDLIEDKRISSVRKVKIGCKLLCLSCDILLDEILWHKNLPNSWIYSFYISWPHVFASIHPETSNTNADEMAQEVCNFSSDIVIAKSQISKTYQTTVSDLNKGKHIFLFVMPKISNAALIIYE